MLLTDVVINNYFPISKMKSFFTAEVLNLAISDRPKLFKIQWQTKLGCYKAISDNFYPFHILNKEDHNVLVNFLSKNMREIFHQLYTVQHYFCMLKKLMDNNYLKFQ